MEDFDSTLLSPEQNEMPTESVYAAIGGEENDSEMASTSSTTDYTRGSIDEIGGENASKAQSQKLPMPK